MKAAGAALACALAVIGHAAPVRAAASAPEVSKIEPPGWWARHSVNPVRVMLTGRNLAGARVGAVGEGLRAGAARTSAPGTYLFVDLFLDEQALPGVRRLRVVGPGGATEADFEVLSPLPRAGRFQGFSPDDVLYLIMPDRFADGDPTNDETPASRGLLDRNRKRFYHGGDLQGIFDRLPYLKDLGVTALWLTPVYENTNRLNEGVKVDGEPLTDYHGYHSVDFYGVEDHFGDMATLRALVDAAHRLGLKVIQDEVVNHTGPEHSWVADPPTPTWFNGTRESHLANVWQRWAVVDPHSTPEVRKGTIDGWFIDLLPDLNQDDDEVARYLIQNTLWWVGMAGFDGIRQDTLPYVPRRFWQRWMAAIKRECPGFKVLGEMSDPDPALVSFFQGGATRYDGIDTGIDSLYDFPLYYAIRHAFAQGKPIEEVAVALGHDHLYVDPNVLVTFLGLHDEPRFMNEPGATIAGLKLAFTCLMMVRGIPLVYYGDEIAMTGGADPDNRRDFPGGWPADARSAFEASGRTADEQSVFEHVRRLTHLRAELPALRRGAMLNLVASGQTWAFARVKDNATVIVVFNNAPEPATVDCPLSALRLAEGARLEDRLGVAPEVTVEDGRVWLRLPGRAAAVYVPVLSQ